VKTYLNEDILAVFNVQQIITNKFHIDDFFLPLTASGWSRVARIISAQRTLSWSSSNRSLYWLRSSSTRAISTRVNLFRWLTALSSYIHTHNVFELAGFALILLLQLCIISLHFTLSLAPTDETFLLQRLRLVPLTSTVTQSASSVCSTYLNHVNLTFIITKLTASYTNSPSSYLLIHGLYLTTFLIHLPRRNELFEKCD